MFKKSIKHRDLLLKLRNFCIKDFYKTIHSIPRGVIYSSFLMIIHYFQLFSFSFGNLDNFSAGQTEISLLFQQLCFYAKIFPLLTIISGISAEFSLKIWLIFSFCLNISWIFIILIQGYYSDFQHYRLKKVLMLSTTIIFQLYHWIFFLTFMQVCFEFIFQSSNYSSIYLFFAVFNEFMCISSRIIVEESE